MHYTGVLWDSKEVFDSSWERSEPAEFVAADGSKTQGGVIPGFAKALIGQTVGSQIVAVIPPKQRRGKPRPGRPISYNADHYRGRNVVERCVGWLKECRVLATRYEKLALNYLGLVKLAMIERYLRLL